MQFRSPPPYQIFIMFQRVAENLAPSISSAWLPIDSAKSCHNVKMPVSAQNWKSVLAAERSDPDIIGRNRSSSFLEFRAKRGVIDGRPLVHVKDAVIRKRIHQPLLVPLAFPGLSDTISILAQY